MNIIKRTPYFPGLILCHVLLACCLMMARCTVESMIRNYHQYISKLLFESELDLLKCCNIDIFTSILTQNKLKHTSHCCVHLMLQNRNIGEKSWRIVVIRQIHQSFFPSKVFYCTVAFLIAIMCVITCVVCTKQSYTYSIYYVHIAT